MTLLANQSLCTISGVTLGDELPPLATSAVASSWIITQRKMTVARILSLAVNGGDYDFFAFG
jgi:hypothetical protein